MTVVRLLLLLSVPVLCACSFAGNSFLGNDPITGGVNSGRSDLVDIPLPAGLQRYPEHGFINIGAAGEKTGLETLRGYVNQSSTLRQFYDSLKQGGWELLTWQQKGSRAWYLYVKNAFYLSIVSRPQGNLSIFELWAAPKTEDNGAFFDTDPEVSIAPEEYTPLVDHSEEEKSSPAVETWGSPIEEREL